MSAAGMGWAHDALLRMDRSYNYKSRFFRASSLWRIDLFVLEWKELDDGLAVPLAAGQNMAAADTLIAKKQK